MGNILRLGGSKGRKIRQREKLNCDAVSTEASAKSWSWGGPAPLPRHGQPFFPLSGPVTECKLSQEES